MNRLRVDELLTESSLYVIRYVNSKARLHVVRTCLLRVKTRECHVGVYHQFPVPVGPNQNSKLGRDID